VNYYYKNKLKFVCINNFKFREYDVPYDVRVVIDLKLNVGLWYSVKGQGYDAPIITPRPELVDRPVNSRI
jgi:hypothetical protein